MEITTLKHAVQIHAQIIKARNDKNPQELSKVFTFSALSTSGSIPYARSIFDSLHTPNSYFFNTLIRGYAKSQDPTQALLFFITVQQHEQTVKPDKFTYPFLFKACSRLRANGEGKQVHALVCKSGLHLDRFVQNSLIHFYSCCTKLDYAKTVFERMPNRDVVSWTSTIDGYVDCDHSIEAIQLFEQMQNNDIDPNDATVVSVLRACADVGALSFGKKIHQIAKQNKLLSKTNVVTALIDMYAKCGCVDSALQLFEETFHKDVYIWTAIISGLASHGQCQQSIDLFHQMEIEKIRPDERTLTAVLSACRNMGWVNQAYKIFNNMEKTHGITPNIQHYGCMVDLLARGGHLDEAKKFIKRMPIEPDAVLWRTLVWACNVHGDTDQGELLMNQNLLQTDSMDGGNYVLLSNVYASAGKWREKAKVRELMTKRRIEKLPGCSKIEVNGTIHEFLAGDSSHPEAEKIYKKWAEVEERLITEGYSPDLSEVLLNIDDEEKAFQLSHHSEKLAVAFGLINTKSMDKILVVKNLRSCKDCHSAMKLVSKIYGREIVIRDRVRFHQFKNGCCSCGDYW
ncbi:pentatricopeptide repeat-containing protein At5g66520-like [Aristolochia californica]|uniref:pentatricopeptide repeat-containing protein At5g66520-like n=1 Tax=Aristolochia californica TaxID=171875 RepID=UPI0035D60A20